MTNAEILAKLAASGTRVYVTYCMPTVVLSETGEHPGDRTEPMSATAAKALVATLESLGCTCAVHRSER